MRNVMPAIDKGIEALSQALLDQEFRPVDEFDSFVTFERDGDIFKIQVGSDGAFAVFGDGDELITEGEGSDDLYRVLVSSLGSQRKTRGPRRG
jgi:hypothetical protein